MAKLKESIGFEVKGTILPAVPNDTPCFGCEQRSAGCHSKCKEYKLWKIKKDAHLKAYKNTKELQGYYVGKIDNLKNHRPIAFSEKFSRKDNK